MSHWPFSFPRRHRGWPRAFAAGCVLLTASAGAATKVNFVAPTPEELKMTSVPGHPELPAVVLNREEVTQDTDGQVLHYSRIKVLTNEGRDFANVQLDFVHGKDNKKITDITGRTIQPDGTIVPFSGQPYERVLEKRKGAKLQQTVFTLPDVRVGSILEYSYIEHYSNYVQPPVWDVQGELFVQREHFVWNPVDRVRGEHNMLTKTSVYAVLPPDAHVTSGKMSYTGVYDLGGKKRESYALTVTDVPPMKEESYSPPISSQRYRVRFEYVHSAEDKYWAEEGKYWSKDIDKFVHKNDHLDAMTKQVTSNAASEDDKLRAIYAAVMAMENTEFTRDRVQSENKASEHEKINEANDVLELKRGTPNALALLFLAMARSAGLSAYAMYVPDRAEVVFAPEWLSFKQFSDMLVMASVDGKERYFDPGARDCPYGQLAWWHQQVQGLRQSADGAVLDRTPAAGANENRVQRHATLQLDAQGNGAGTVDMTLTGAAALRLRRVALGSDEQGFRHSVTEYLQGRLPPDTEVEITAVDHVQEYEQPLGLHAHISGPMAVAAGKRRLMAAGFFAAQDTSPFPDRERTHPIDFRYPEHIEDTVEVKLPRSFALQGAASPVSLNVRKDGSYKLSITPVAGGFTAHREFVFDGVLMPASEYPDLRDFFAKLGNADKEQLVLEAAR